MRLSLLMSLLLGACTISSTGGEPASVQCTTGADGQMICTQNGEEDNDPGDDNEGDPTDPGAGGGQVTCSSEECVVRCDEGGTNEDGSESEVVHCIIECENGLRCDQVCNGDSCALYCTCPDGGGEPPPPCTDENPENCQDPQPCDDSTAEGCQPPPPDDCEERPDLPGCPTGDPGEECDNPDDPACCNHETDAEHEAYCQEHPESPEC